MRHLPRPLMLQLSCSTTVAALQVGLLVLTRCSVILNLCWVHALTCKVRGMLLFAGFTNPTVCWLCLVMLAGLSSIRRSSNLHCCCCVTERGLHTMRSLLVCITAAMQRPLARSCVQEPPQTQHWNTTWQQPEPWEGVRMTWSSCSGTCSASPMPLASSWEVAYQMVRLL